MFTTIQFQWIFDGKNHLTLRLTMKAKKRLAKGGYKGQEEHQQRRTMKAKKNTNKGGPQRPRRT